MTYKVLAVISSHQKTEDGNHPTGWWLSELAHPYYKLAPHCEIVIASPSGGEVPPGSSSVEAANGDEEAQKFLNEKEGLWKNSEKLEHFKGKAKNFDAIFFVGGHGPMFDLVDSPDSQQIIREFYESDKVVSAVCHGPAALVNVKLSDGSYLVAGQQATCISNAEEDVIGMSSAMPFLLETELTKQVGGAGRFEAADPWGTRVVVSGRDGRLITGQNPQSAGAIGEAVLKALSG